MSGRNPITGTACSLGRRTARDVFRRLLPLGSDRQLGASRARRPGGWAAPCSRSSGFAAIGYTIVALIPTAWITTLLGGSNPLSIVLAATLGIPSYISTEASLPLVVSLVHGGLGAGPAMAFLVTGAGTSAAAIAGGLLIARWRVLAVVVGVRWVGAIGLGLATMALRI